MSFDALPPELLHMICDFSEVPEMKSLRATNRALAACITPRMIFEEVVLYMTRASLGYIQDVAQNQHIATNVQRLWIQGDYPELIKNFRDFEKAWKDECECRRILNPFTKGLFEERGVLREEKRWLGTEEYERRLAVIDRRIGDALATVPVPKISRRHLRDHLRQYKKLRKDAIRMQSDASIYNALRQLFLNCPNLKSIDYTLEHIIRVTTTKQNKQFMRGLITPYGQPVMLRQGVEGVSQVIMAASDANFSPRELRLGGVSSEVLALQHLIKRMPSFTRNLEILEWHFLIPADRITDTPSLEEEELMIDNFRGGYFHYFLKHSTMLRELTIEIPCDIADQYETPFTLYTIFGAITFNHLTKFHFDTMLTEADEIIDFFLRHSATLEDIFLIDWALESGVWREVFEAIAGKLECLKEFELRGAFGDQRWVDWFGDIGFTSPPTKRGKAMSRYVRGEIDEYPENNFDEEPHTDAYTESSFSSVNGEVEVETTTQNDLPILDQKENIKQASMEQDDTEPPRTPIDQISGYP